MDLESILDPPMPKKPMSPIDLTLAINFIPAVVCLCKAVLISFSLSILRPGEHLGGFVILVMVLNIDRAVSCVRIFDENAVQCCILAAWVINFLRGLAEAPKLVLPVTTFLWFLFGYCLVLEPRRVQEFFVMYGHGSGGVFKRILPGILTSLFVVVMAFTPLNLGLDLGLKEESVIIKSARSISFACLCVAWVYVVSVWRPKPRNNGSCVFECHLLLSRFCPILYVQWIVAVLYAAGCVGILLYHYVRIHVSPVPPHSPRHDFPQAEVLAGSTNASIAPAVSAMMPMTVIAPGCAEMNANYAIVEEEDEDLEAYFRTACQSRQQQ